MSANPNKSIVMSMNTPSRDPELLCKVRQLIRKRGVIGRQDSVLLAVSGGADSVALFDLFLAFKNEYGLTLAVAHLDHGLRGADSEADRRFVEALARTKGIPCYWEHRDVAAYREKHRLSLEEAARNVRYGFLFETADRYGFTKIATAHHADDNAELVLMNLMRGSGPAGLSGMDVISRNGRLIRPFLHVQRSDISDYIKDQGLAFREDRTNRDRTFLRNRIRLELMPLLDRDYRKGVARTVSRTAGIIREDEDWMESCAGPVYERAVRELAPGTTRLSVRELRGLHVALLRRVIRMALRHVKGDLNGIGYIHVDDVIGLLNQSTGAASLDLPGRVRVLINRGLLTFVRESENLRRVPPCKGRETVEAFEYKVERPERDRPLMVAIPETGQRLRFSHLRGKGVYDLAETGPDTVVLDMDRLSFPLTLRTVRPKDRFRPLGMTGHQRLSRFFSNRKIPVEQRGKIPVLVSGHQIVWVCGHRIDDSVKVITGTENALKIELFLA